MSDERLSVSKPLKWKIFRSFFSVFVLFIVVIIVGLFIVFFRMSYVIRNDNFGMTQEVKDYSFKASELEMTRVLSNSVVDKAELIDNSFSAINDNLKLVARVASSIISEPKNFPSSPYYLARKEDNGKLSVSLLCPKPFTSLTDSEKKSLSVQANISELLKLVVERSRGVRSAMVVFDDSGFSFIADSFSALRIAADGMPNMYDMRLRPWYVDTKALQKEFVSNPYLDIFSGVSCITYAKPFYKKDGSFAGVAETTIDMPNLEKIVRRAVFDTDCVACLIDEKGELIYSTAESGNFFNTDSITNKNETFVRIIHEVQNEKSGLKLLTVDGVEYFTSYAPIRTVGWTLVVFYPYETVLKSSELLVDKITDVMVFSFEETNKQRIIVGIFFISILVFIFFIFIFTGKRISANLTNSITMLIDKVSRIEGDNLVFTWEERSGDEVQLLAESFCRLTKRLRLYVDDVIRTTAEKERMGTELSVATNIQANMLPSIYPPFPERTEFEIFALMTPAKEVGGDFYDFFMVDKRHLAVVVADVSGKGVPAALFMVIGKTLIKDHTISSIDLGSVFTEVNNILFSANGDGMFITAFEGVLDLYSGEFRYVNAGHEPPFISHDGVFVEKELDAGFVLAGMPGMKYQCGSLFLNPGDKFFQYTDGVTEATNAHEKLYGMKRLENILNKSVDKIPCDVIRAVKEDVDAFVGDAPQFDDITMLCFEYKHRMNVGELMVNESLVVIAARENLFRVQEFVISVMKKGCASKASQSQIDIATEEVFINIASYAYSKESLDNYVWINCYIDGHDMTLTFKDKGVPYNPLKKQDPKIGDAVENMTIGGFGIYMTKQLCDEVVYEHTDGYNVLRLKKKIA